MLTIDVLFKNSDKFDLEFWNKRRYDTEDLIYSHRIKVFDY